MKPNDATVTTELGLRVSYSGTPEKLAEILRILRRSAGDVYAHLLHPAEPASLTAVFLCENPAEGVLALRGEGIAADTETLVAIRLPARRDTLSHLVGTLTAEGIQIRYSHSACAGEAALTVLRTSDNPKAADVLRGFLTRRVAYPAGPLEAPGGTAPPAGGQPA